MSVPPPVGALVDRIVGVPGVVAVALGGSRATGTALPESDTDLGLYYDADELDVAALSALSLEYGGAVAPPGAWGPWVDGGAWLTVDGAPVDIILRDVVRVRAQCERARGGGFAFHPQPGHPLGFLDVAYAGEAATAIPLADADGVLAALRALVTPYPPMLRDATIDGLWQVDFELDAASKGARRGDATYVSLCLATAAMRIAHAWHAAAGVWVLNEKNLVPRVAQLDLDTRGFTRIATEVCAAAGSTPAQLDASIALLRLAPRPLSAGRP